LLTTQIMVSQVLSMSNTSHHQRRDTQSLQP